MKVGVTYDRYLSLYFEIQEALQSKVYTRVSKFRNIFASRFNEFKFQPRLKGGGRTGGRSICRWTRNEAFQYSVSRFWEKYRRETVLSPLDGAVIAGKNNEKSGFETIIKGILVFPHLFKKNYFWFFTLFRFLKHLEDF